MAEGNGWHTEAEHEKATGPLTQATGPLRSDAGVGIGMLRGSPLLLAI